MDKSYDEELLEINHLATHPCLLPFIGDNYGKLGANKKILFIGESHYIGDTDVSGETDDWYSYHCDKFCYDYKLYYDFCNTTCHIKSANETNEKNCLLSGKHCSWTSTRCVFNWEINQDNVKHRFIKPPVQILQKVYLNKYSLNLSLPDVLNSVAIFNYFQRPQYGRGGLCPTLLDSKTAQSTSNSILSILKPDIVVFLSKKAFWNYKKSVHYDLLPSHIAVGHPSHWNRWKKNPEYNYEAILTDYFLKQI